jgi:hypothetical protein
MVDRRGSKLGALIEIPCTAGLRRMLESIDRKSPLILTTKTGRALKKRYFLQLWNRAMKKAGLWNSGFSQYRNTCSVAFS